MGGLIEMIENMRDDLSRATEGKVSFWEVVKDLTRDFREAAKDLEDD